MSHTNILNGMQKCKLVTQFLQIVAHPKHKMGLNKIINGLLFVLNVY